MDGSTAEAGTAANDALGRKIDQLIRLTTESVTLQRIALLEMPGSICRFGHNGVEVALSLPDAQRDYVQKQILNHRSFYETRQLTELSRRGIVRRGATVCDVGANIGNHSVYFGRILGAQQVIAFEPQPHCHETLLFNFALNGLGDERVINAMVGPTSGAGRLTAFNPVNYGGTTFAPDDAGDVPMVSLDDALTPREQAEVSLIKIDVEKMEMAVLQGATGLLSRHAPPLWIELLAKDDAYERAVQFLAPFGYTADGLSPTDFLFTAKT